MRMMNRSGLLISVALCGLALGLAADAAGLATNEVTLFLVGDSTMADKPLAPPNPERGWGQLLPLYFQDDVRIENHAVNGRSSKSFLDEGRCNAVRDRMRPGDYVIIQFGHNDEKRQDPKRFTEPFGSFQENLKRCVREARERRAIPILATPVVRRKFAADGKLEDTHGDYTKAVRLEAQEEKVPLLDLNRDSAELVQRLGPESSKKLYKWVAPGEYENHPEGFQDDTHFNAVGASRICDLAMEEMQTAVPDLARRLRNRPGVSR